MFAERNIWNHLRENHKVREGEESEVFHHEEETETPEDILNEDWRSGTIDWDKYCADTLKEAGRLLFSIRQLENKYKNDIEVLKKLKQLRTDIKSKF